MKRYYSKVLLGDNVYYDFLIIDEKNMKSTYVQECEYSDDLFLGCHRLRRKQFLKKLTKIEDGTYELERKDGAKDRVRKADVENALDLHCGLSTYPDLCKVRPEKGEYFLDSRIEKAVFYFLDDRISFFQLQYWANLFSMAVMESFNFPPSASDAYQFAVVKSIGDHLLLCKQESSDEEIKEVVKKILPEIASLKEKYLKLVGFRKMKGEETC